MMLVQHMIPPGYITELIRDLRNWSRRRARKELDVTPLTEAIDQAEKYRALINSVRQLRGMISDEIKAIENDSRFQDKPATLDRNAPLALIQFGMVERRRALAQILEQLGVKWVSTLTIPNEVREMVDMSVPDTHIRWSHKLLTPRVVAWEQCSMPQQVRGRPWRQRNPWRKAHTENFWAWFRIEEGGE